MRHQRPAEPATGSLLVEVQRIELGGLWSAIVAAIGADAGEADGLTTPLKYPRSCLGRHRRENRLPHLRATLDG